MRYQILVPGMEGHRVEVETAKMTKPSAVLVDGLPAPKGQNKAEFLIYRRNGTMSVVQLGTQWLDSVPKVTVDGVPQTLAPPLSGGEKALVFTPLLLVIGGGLIGGLCGGLAMTANMAIVRKDWPAGTRYAAASGVILAALALDALLLWLLLPYLPFHRQAAPSGGFSPPSPGPGFPGPSFPSPPPMPAPPPGFPGGPGHP